MNWAQLLAWVNNPVRTLLEFVAVATALGLPTAGTLAQVRTRIRNRIATEPNPMVPVPAAVATAAGGPPAPPPPPPNALPFWMIILIVAAAMELVGDLVGLVVNPTGINVVLKTWILTGVLGFSLLWDVGAIVTLNVFNPPALTRSRKKNGTYWATFGAALIAIALVLIWVPMGIPMAVLTVGIEALLTLVLISDIVAAYYLLR